MLGMKDSQASIALTCYLKSTDEDQISSVCESSRASDDEITSLPEAFQYLLSLCATRSAIQQVVRYRI